MKKLDLAFGIVALGLSACTTSAVDPGAQNVRVINEAESKGCKFLDSVSTNSGNTLNQNPEQEARNRAINRTASLGGNALRIVSTNQQMSDSGIGSLFMLTGEAYSCK